LAVRCGARRWSASTFSGSIVTLAQGEARTAPRQLARQPAFRAVWAGHTVSPLGSQVTALTFPLAAGLTLGAGSGAMARLGTLRWRVPLE
jgi:hypothetical protein